MTARLSDLVPSLTDGVVGLRAHTLDDIGAIVEQARDPDSQRWTSVPRGYPRDAAVGFLERVVTAWRDPAGDRLWAIEWIDDARPRFGGTIEVRLGESADTAWLGFGLHPAARGSGLMSRAVRLVAGQAFGTGLWGQPLARLHWRAVVGNWPARRVAWATGFAFHGTLPASHVDPSDPQGAALDSWHASLATGEVMAAPLPWFEPPVLEQGGIRLRPWRDEDIDCVEDRVDPAHWTPARSVLGREMFPRWLHSRRELMSQGTSVEWCVASAATDRALGSVTVFSRAGAITGDVAELGYQLFPSARGHGAATTAARLAIGHALAPTHVGGLGLRRLVAGTAADNTASNRVLQANGFVVYGREHAVDPLPGGAYGDELHWELLPGRASGMVASPGQEPR